MTYSRNHLYKFVHGLGFVLLLLYQLVLLVYTCFLFCSSGFSLTLQRFSRREGFFCLFLIEFLYTSFGKTPPLSMWIKGTLFLKRGLIFFNNAITVSRRPHRFYCSSNCLALFIYHLYQSLPWLFKTVHLMLLH